MHIFNYSFNFIALLKQNLGENIYTIQDVVREIRDKATRARLQVLPYDLNFRNPSPESVKAGLFSLYKNEM